MTYYKLLAPKHKGTVVRADGETQQKYVAGNGWIETGVMMQYFSDESDFYDNYIEITESEAMEIVNRKSSGSS